MNGLQHGSYFLDLAGGHCGPHVAVEMHHATLPQGIGIEIRKVLHQAKALIGHEQLDALQAAVLELT